MDTFIVLAASCDTLGAAEADYHAAHDFYLTSGLLDTYDAAVITRDDGGKVRIVAKHEQPTRQGACHGLGIGLVGGRGGSFLALHPPPPSSAGGSPARSRRTSRTCMPNVSSRASRPCRAA
jgi:hypothetical protein